MPAKKKRPVGRPPLSGSAMEMMGFRFHEKLIKRLDRACKRLGITRSEFVREAVERKLEEEDL